MRFGFFIVAFLHIVSCFTVQCQTKLLAPKKIKNLPAFHNLIEGALVSTKMIDFNGDGKDDFNV